MSRFVLDASAALAYLFNERENAEYSSAVFERLRETGAVVPSIWRSEVANATVVRERQRRLTAPEVDAVFRVVSKLPGSVDETGDIVGEVVPLARRWQLSVYDAQYLELALRRELALATLDRGLRQAASAAGAEVVELTE